MLDLSRQELRNYKAELEKRGEIFDLARLAPPKPPSENNGTAELIAAGEEIDVLKKKNDIKMWSGGQIESIPGRAEVGHRRGTVKRLKEELSWEEVTAEMEPIRPVLARLREAAKAPVLDVEIDYTQGFSMKLPFVGPLLVSGQYLGKESLLLLHQGDTGTVIENIVTQLRLAGMMFRQPVLINQLVAISLVGIAQVSTWEVLQANPTAQELLTLQAAWESINVLDQFANTLRVERAAGITAFSLSPKELHTLSAMASTSTRVSNLLEQVPLGFRLLVYGPSDQRKLIRDYQTLIDLFESKANGSLFLSESARIEKDVASSGLTRIISRLTFPSMSGALRKMALTDATQKLTVAAIAIRRFQLNHDGQPPESLAALVPAYLSAVPIDWMDGQPLRYRREGDGFLLYAVGDNGVDDGGDPNGEVGKKRRDFRGGLDIVWPRAE